MLRRGTAGADSASWSSHWSCRHREEADGGCPWMCWDPHGRRILLPEHWRWAGRLGTSDGGSHRPIDRGSKRREREAAGARLPPHHGKETLRNIVCSPEARRTSRLGTCYPATGSILGLLGQTVHLGLATRAAGTGRKPTGAVRLDVLGPAWPEDPSARTLALGRPAGDLR
ncbi:hypothetical protein D5F01_LYC02241 [Larimichthys crocea]|uniref:Uncharacterized protein n=1 Tax=Larimichthys crocea TaxID=215358 RepID=A0A6G0J8F9_LARCR|nr:hypothetical protein D5F01_LYC02241 [Larimichthys crocea]